MAKHQGEVTLNGDPADHVRGSTTAPVTMLVYGDYECPYTRELELAVAGLRHLDHDSFRYVFRYFPLREIHPHAQMAAEAAETVYSLVGQDAFWKMHDALFANQDDLDGDSVGRLAAAAGADPGAFGTALKTHRFAERIERDVRSGQANGVEGTPSVFINGQRYRGARDIASLRAALY
jgi:NhaA family Na+:H+ antiporter